MKLVEERFGKLGYKSRESNGYYTFKGARIKEIGSDSYDFYFKTDRKNRRDKDNTTLTMLISSGYEKFIGDTTNASVISNAKSFLNSQVNGTADFDLDLQIAAQEELLKKADKSLAGMVEDGQGLSKKREKIETDIQENLKKQETQKAEAEKQLLIFNTLKEKRKH